ncbi:MAG: type II toxin-antitoxin system VapC family toxin [bacterium]
MILVDSCGWLEYFADGPLADKYFKYLKNPLSVIVPTIVEYEVYKKAKRSFSEEKAISAAAQMHFCRVVPLSAHLALWAADLSLTHDLPMADAIIYATAQAEKCQVVTSDEHFKNLPEVIFIK